MKSDATSVEGYVASLPAERRAAIGAVRDAVLAQLPTDVIARYERSRR